MSFLLLLITVLSQRCNVVTYAEQLLLYNLLCQQGCLVQFPPLSWLCSKRQHEVLQEWRKAAHFDVCSTSVGSYSNGCEVGAHHFVAYVAEKVCHLTHDADFRIETGYK